MKYKNTVKLFLGVQKLNKVAKHWLSFLNLTIINVFQKKLKRMNDSLSNFSWIWRLLAWRGGLRCNTKRLKTRLKRLKYWVELKFDLIFIKLMSISIKISASTHLTPCISSFSVAPRDSACDISSKRQINCFNYFICGFKHLKHLQYLFDKVNHNNSNIITMLKSKLVNHTL